jgi:protein SCO1
MPQDKPSVPAISRSRKIVLLAALLGVAALGLAEVSLWQAPSQQAASLIGGPFKLDGPDGRSVTDADMKGRPFLVYFGYTHCPDVCPTTLAQISDVLRKLPDKPISVLFVTTDPERDSAASLKDYVSSFDKRIIGLSGDRAAIDQVEKAYRVYARKVPGSNGDYTMDHSSIVYLMDAHGQFVEAFNVERPAEDAAKELATYL